MIIFSGHLTTVGPCFPTCRKTDGDGHAKATDEILVEIVGGLRGCSGKLDGAPIEVAVPVQRVTG